jgi:uncharacterized protein (TIGR01777 family)
LIGSALKSSLAGGGHQVFALVRRPAIGAGEISWDPPTGTIDAAALEGMDAVVNLSGKNLAEGRWTVARKKEFADSRIASTTLLSQTLSKLHRPPRVLVSASAIGFYGDRQEELLTEISSRGNGFLAELCEKWEAATRPAIDAGIRVVHPRIGVVLSREGGALKKMLLPFKFGAGGVIGSGRQYMSWISLHDLVSVLKMAIDDSQLQGAVNAVAPNPVTNRNFAKALGHVLHRPTILPMPAFAVKVLFGEMGKTLLLEGARVIPRKLEAAGLQFQHPTLEAALRAELNP